MNFLRLQRDNGIQVVTFDRPAKLNALCDEMFDELRQALDQLGRDESVRALILTGSERAFCGGTDINELSDLTPQQAQRLSQRGQDLCSQIDNFPVPVIAAVNGIAAGGGCEIALACHIRIASPNSSFSLPEIRLGAIAGYGGTQRLSRDVGLGRARELLLTGKTISAQEAHGIGLVNRVAYDALLEAMSLAREIEQLSPLAIRACLKAVNVGIELPMEEGLALERELFAELFAGEDVKEGTRAFLEKRKAVFKHR